MIIYFTTNWTCYCLVTKSGLHLKICANSRRKDKYVYDSFNKNNFSYCCAATKA